VIKQVLERLVVSNDILTPGQRTPHVQLLQQANFLVNIYVGTGTLSSFQVFRGYHPSLLGMPPTVVTQDMLAARAQLVAVCALSRLLRSKRFDQYSSQLRVNQEVYLHAQNKPGSAKGTLGWSRHRVVALHPSLAHTPPRHQKRGRPRMVSYADVRPIPADPIAQSAFVLALTAECTPSGRCVHGGDEDEDWAQDGAVGIADGTQDGAVKDADGAQDGAVETRTARRTARSKTRTARGTVQLPEARRLY
jgi:hypothetical protein